MVDIDPGRAVGLYGIGVRSADTTQGVNEGHAGENASERSRPHAATNEPRDGADLDEGNSSSSVSCGWNGIFESEAAFRGGTAGLVQL
jgi:hypothetical protein